MVNLWLCDEVALGEDWRWWCMMEIKMIYDDERWEYGEEMNEPAAWEDGDEKG